MSPGLICPLRTASSRAKGIDAALVLPYSAKFETTCKPKPTSKRLAGTPRYHAVRMPYTLCPASKDEGGEKKEKEGEKKFSLNQEQVSSNGLKS